MASISFSATKGKFIDTLAAGSQTWTEATSAPGAGTIEVRIDMAQNWTKREIQEALDSLVLFIQNANNTTAVPL